MATDFSALEARINASVSKVLDNAAGILAGQPVTGILSAGFDDATFSGHGAAGSSPAFNLLATSVPASPAGVLLAITCGVAQGNYKVTRDEPDGTGRVTLYLTKA